MISPLPSLRRLFERIDKDHGGDLDRAEVRDYLESLGIGGGMFGGSILTKAVNGVMKKLGDGGERVSWQQFVRHGARLLPAELLTADGKLDRSLAPAVFASIAGSAVLADLAAVAAFVAGKIKGTALALLSGTVSDSAARVTIDALDADGDHAFTQEDLVALVDDINREVERVPRSI